jgi:hypothetical protein
MHGRGPWRQWRNANGRGAHLDAGCAARIARAKSEEIYFRGVVATKNAAYQVALRILSEAEGSVSATTKALTDSLHAATRVMVAEVAKLNAALDGLKQIADNVVKLAGNVLRTLSKGLSELLNSLNIKQMKFIASKPSSVRASPQVRMSADIMFVGKQFRLNTKMAFPPNFSDIVSLVWRSIKKEMGL